MLIQTVGADSKPFRPDSVYWYRPPAGGAAVETGAECANKGCTTWVIREKLSGIIYVAASYWRDVDPYCGYSAYDARRINLDSAAYHKVTLDMETAMMCE